MHPPGRLGSFRSYICRWTLSSLFTCWGRAGSLREPIPLLDRYNLPAGNFTITGMQPKGRASGFCHFLFFFYYYYWSALNGWLLDGDVLDVNPFLTVDP